MCFVAAQGVLAWLRMTWEPEEEVCGLEDGPKQTTEKVPEEATEVTGGTLELHCSPKLLGEHRLEEREVDGQVDIALENAPTKASAWTGASRATTTWVWRRLWSAMRVLTSMRPLAGMPFSIAYMHMLILFPCVYCYNKYKIGDL